MTSTDGTLFCRLINLLETKSLLNDVDGNPMLDDGTLVKRILEAENEVGPGRVSCLIASLSSLPLFYRCVIEKSHCFNMGLWHWKF